MEDIQIISSIIDEYKEQFKDQDYKNTMDALMRIHNIKQINAPDNFVLERENILSDSSIYDFRKIINGLFLHRDANRYIFDSNVIYKHFFEKYFIITGNDKDIVNSMTLRIKIQIQKRNLNFFLSNYIGVKPILSKNKKCYHYSGIKIR
jgi:hypothetical protein